jgi:hypothetical protein
VGDRDRLRFAAGGPSPALMRRVVDPVSGYAVPQEVRSSLSGDGMKIDLQVSTPTYLRRMDILENVNFLLRTIVRTFIARPYTYWFRARATAEVTHADGTVTHVPGTFLGEMIFVND